VCILLPQGHQAIAKSPYGILAGIKEGELFKEGEWGAEICDLMKPSPNDIICKGKSGLCGFQSTNLDFLLRQNDVKNVVLGGFLTNCCIESSMRTGYELGYKVYTMKDCCAATSVAAQDAAYEHTFGMFSIPTTSTVSLLSIVCLFLFCWRRAISQFSTKLWSPPPGYHECFEGLITYYRKQ
jgi:ureidoacrylate peracid hydrolase